MDAAGKIRFEQNVGQFDPSFDAAVRRGGSTVLIGPGRIYVRLNNATDSHLADVEMHLLGANAEATAEFENRLPLSTSYFLGNDPNRWHAGVANYSRVRYREIYPGVDLVYYGKGNDVEHDFIVAPGVDPSTIDLAFTGIAGIRFADEGDLVLETVAGDLVVSRPHVYQDFNGEQRQVAAAFERRGVQGAGFELGAYDRTRPLIIDPGLELGTFIGGSGSDDVRSVAVDADDDLWVAGTTNSPDFPAPGGADPPPIAGASDVFVAEFSHADGKGANSDRIMTSLVFLGGTGDESPTTIGVDDKGRIHVIGRTSSTDFPVTPDAFQAQYGGGPADLFFTVLSPANGAALSKGRARTDVTLAFSSFSGGDGDEDTTGKGVTMVIDTGLMLDAGDLLPCTAIFGITTSSNPSTTQFGDSQRQGPSDGALKIFCENPTGGTPSFRKMYASLLGGPGMEFGGDAWMSKKGDVVVGMYTDSTLPTSEQAIQKEPSGGIDAYIMSFSLNDNWTLNTGFGFDLKAATYLGTPFDDFGVRIAGAESQTPEGDTEVFPIFSFNTTSPIPPVSVVDGQSFTQENPGGLSGFLGILNPDMSEVLAATWVGGPGNEFANQLSFDSSLHCISSSGYTDSDPFPSTANAPLPGSKPGINPFFRKDCSSTQRRESDGSGFEVDTIIFADGFESGDTSAWGNLAPAPEVSPKALGGDDSDFGFDAITTLRGNDVIAGATFFSGGSLSASKGDAAGGFPITENAPQPLPGGGESDGFLIEIFVPLLRRAAILGSADFGGRAETGIAPQEIMTIFIARGGPETPIGLTLDNDGKVTTQLGPTRVLFNGEPGPMIATSLNQVSAVVPSSMSTKGQPGGVIVEVEVDGQRSNRVRFAEAEANPAIFALNSQGFGQGAILNPDFSVNGPANPSDSFIVVFGTGGGATDVPCPDGELAPSAEPFPRLTLPQRALVDGVEAQLPYAGSAPDLVCGVNQWNVVPTNNPSGVVSVQVCSGDNCSQEGITAVFE